MLKKDGCVLRYSFKSAGPALRLVHMIGRYHKLVLMQKKPPYQRSSGKYVTLEKLFMNMVFILKGNDPFWFYFLSIILSKFETNRPCGGNPSLGGENPLLDIQGNWMTSPAFWVLALLAAHIAQVDHVAPWRCKQKVFTWTGRMFGEI